MIIALRPMMPLLDYAVNYNYIKKNLCENRSKPELLCNGKCYLKKEIAKASQEKTKNDSRITLSSLSDIFIISDEFTFIHINYYYSESSDSLSELNFSYKFNLFSKIFHPPLI